MSYRLLKDKIVDISLAILLVIMTALTVVFLSDDSFCDQVQVVSLVCFFNLIWYKNFIWVRI